MRLFPSSEHVRAQRLSRLDRFAGMTPADVKRVVAAATTIRVAPGEVLVEEDTVGATAYVVLSGELAITQRGEPIGTMRAGDLTGEIGAVAGPYRSATVTAVVETEALELAADVLKTLCDELPAFRAAVWDTAQKRLTRDQYTE